MPLLEKNMQDNIALSIVQAVFYLLNHSKGFDKIQIIKLLYLSDKYHLLHYGRTVTGDNYFAMRHGPVGSITKDVLSFNDRMSKRVIDYFRSLIDEFECNYRSKENNCSFDRLSDSDKEALDFVLKEFGKLNPFQIRDYTHKYPEWKQHDEYLKQNPGGRKKISQRELFNVIDNRLGITKEQAKEALEIFSDC